MEANKKFSSCQARREGVRQGVCQGVRPVTASGTNIWSNTSLTVNCLTKITFQSMLVTNYWEASHCQPANKAKLLKFLVVLKLVVRGRGGGGLSSFILSRVEREPSWSVITEMLNAFLCQSGEEIVNHQQFWNLQPSSRDLWWSQI